MIVAGTIFQRAKLVFALLFTSIVASASADTSIPEMANLAGIRVGYDTMQRLDRHLGPALVSVGGHPRGVHEWRSRQTGWGLYADGFYYNAHGRVIDSLSIFLPDAEFASRLPKADLTRRQLLFMGVASLGAKEEDVLRLLRDKLPPPKTQQNSLFWEIKGEYRFPDRHHYHFERWTAKLRFEHGLLADIDIEAG